MFVVSVTVVGCDGYTTVAGTVVDKDASPVPRAEVSLTVDGIEYGGIDITKKTGDYFVGGVHPSGRREKKVVVEVAGYLTVEKAVEWNKKHEGVTMTVVTHAAEITDQ